MVQILALYTSVAHRLRCRFPGFWANLAWMAAAMRSRSSAAAALVKVMTRKRSMSSPCST